MTWVGRRLGVVVAAGALALSCPSAVSAASGPTALVLRSTHYCISVADGIALASNPVDLAVCNGSASQQFIVTARSLIYATSADAAIPLCIGNRRALGKAVLLNCRSHNAQVRTHALANGADGFSLTGGFLYGPAVGRLLIQNSSHVNGREAFVDG